jgi:dTDP-4-dehydrorhamnose reductase
MRLLVTGAAGMLGRDVAAAAESAGHDVTGLARRDLDIRDPDAVRAAVAAARPDAVINCAAWTDVDGAEEHEADALRINGTGAGNVATAAPYVVHVSSDYVFEGSATLPYREADATAPAGAYGRSKLAGEVLVAAAGEHAIVRSAWLFGIHGSNFVATMLRLGEDRDKVNVVADQFGCPTFTGHLAGALVDIAERRLSGILHVAGGGSCSWHELAQATFDEAGLDCRAAPVTTAEFPRPAPRPAWSVLGSTRPDAPVLPPWRDGLSAYLRSEVLQ